MKLAHLLGDLHHREFVYPTGNATAGLFLALKALGLSGQNVGIPNIVCINVPLAVLASGNIPVYLDVDPENPGLSLESLKNCPERLAAVVAVHAYGAPCRIEAIAAHCRQFGIKLIEDFAVAQGASVAGKPVGSFGDVSLVSFGAGKIIEQGIGGALLTGDVTLIRSITEHGQRLPEFSPDRQERVEALMRYFKNLYNTYVDADLNAFWEAFSRKALASAEDFLHRFPDSQEEAIVGKVLKLRENVERREARAHELLGLLKDEGEALTPLLPPPGSVYWRFNVLVHEGRNALLRRLIARGYPASSWYAPVDLFFRARAGRNADLSAGDDIGAKILNLWVNSAVDDRYPAAVGVEIRDFLRAQTR